MAEVVHVRYNGQSNNISFNDLDISQATSDSRIRSAVANYLEIPVSKLADFQVEKHANGNITLRPEARFG